MVTQVIRVLHKLELTASRLLSALLTIPSAQAIAMAVFTTAPLSLKLVK